MCIFISDNWNILVPGDTLFDWHPGDWRSKFKSRFKGASHRTLRTLNNTSQGTSMCSRLNVMSSNRTWGGTSKCPGLSGFSEISVHVLVDNNLTAVPDQMNDS